MNKVSSNSKELYHITLENLGQLCASIKGRKEEREGRKKGREGEKERGKEGEKEGERETLISVKYS